MLEWTTRGRRFHIREARDEADYHGIEDVQRDAWGFNDLDIVPMALIVATVHAGGVALAAFEGERMIGFSYAFPSIEGGKVSLHSHMLAVRNDCRNLQAGFFLKLAQREAASSRGIETVTWTFDPLQSLNAHLNFNKLGVVSRRYVVNFYGESSSSPLHQGFGTDRLWVTWMLESERVKYRVAGEAAPASPGGVGIDPRDESAPLLVRKTESGPQTSDFAPLLSGNRCLIEIPHNVNALKERDPAAAIAWREATRGAFLAALEKGFLVEDLLKSDQPPEPRWFYLLTR